MIIFLYLSKILNDEDSSYIKDNEIMITDLINHLLWLMSSNPDLAEAVLLSIGEKLKTKNLNISDIPLCYFYKEIQEKITFNSEQKKIISQYMEERLSASLKDYNKIENVYDKYNESYFNYLSQKTTEDRHIYQSLLISDINQFDINSINNFIKPDKEVQTLKSDNDTTDAEITDDLADM